MATYFISYGDDQFKVSLDRIVRQAQKAAIFDRIIKYSPQDLPAYITSSPLFAFSQGGGYWCWKPYIILHTLANCNIGDVVFYADAGCTLVANSPEWTVFQQHLQAHDAIYFQYRKGFPYPGWKKYCNTEDTSKTAIRHWIKPALADYFRQYKDPDMFDFDSLWAGFIICKKTEKTPLVLDQWLKVTLMHPELVMPPFGAELVELPNSFYDHRCDQSLLSLLVHQYKDQDNALVLPETSESLIGNPAVLATRWRQKKLPLVPYLKYRVFEILHR